MSEMLSFAQLGVRHILDMGALDHLLAVSRGRAGA
jgi:hypothetical protein